MATTASDSATSVAGHLVMRAATLILGGLGAWSVPAPAAHLPMLARALGVRCSGGLPEAGVALTFDDGPHPQGTPAVLDALAAAGARATFFLVGEQVERRPALAREIVAAGHGVELHGHRHRNGLRVGPRALRDDLRRGAAAVADATGRAPRRHRPPYGIFSAAGLATTRAEGLEPLLWSRWGRDWERRATPETIAARAGAGLEDGDIVLLHDADFYGARGSHARTAAALPAILAALGAAGLEPVAL